MSNLFSDLKSILHLILVSKNVLLRKVFIFLDLLSLTFVSQVYINVRDWKSFQTPILKLLELFGRWKFDRLCILSYFLISEDILAVLPPLKRKDRKKSMQKRASMEVCFGLRRFATHFCDLFYFTVQPRTCKKYCFSNGFSMFLLFASTARTPTIQSKFY